MKTELSLTKLAQEIKRQRETKKDYVAETTALSMIKGGSNVGKIQMHGIGNFAVTVHARKQLADKLGIPYSYFERLVDKHPDLLAENVNTLLQREPARNMVRTLDGNIRGFLSDRYRPLDNYDLADVVLPLLMKSGAQVESCAITETKMYIKARCPWLTRELPVPDGLKLGDGHNWYVRKIEGALTITNSEVGAGMIAISPGTFERACTNLAVFRDEGFGKMHVGKKITGEDPVTAYLSDGTKQLDDKVVWAKVGDIVQAILDGRALENIVNKMNKARGEPITGNPQKVVEVTSRKLGLSEDERGGLLRHLINSGEMTRYGMQWAVTRMAGEVDSYDRASELERMGGQIIELPANDWSAIAEAV
jgi:hypothetical protein